MKRRKKGLVPAILISLLLIFSIGLLAHVIKERSAVKEALRELTNYKMRLAKYKKTLEKMARIREKMAEAGFTGEEKGIDLEASFSVIDFNSFVKHITDIYYSGGFFFLDAFEEKSGSPQGEALPSKGKAPPFPMAIASITGKKIVGYRR